MSLQNLNSDMHIDRYFYRGQIPVKQAFIFLHGFPGLFTRNEDLAAYASAFLGADCFIPHFPGIGKSEGEFLFSESIESSISLVEEILQSKSYEHVNLVGHSWGGFVALTALRTFKTAVNKTLLLSPFTIAPPVSALLPDLVVFVKQQELLGKTADLDRLARDMATVLENQHPLLDSALSYTNRESLLIIQALGDTVMPAVANQARYGNLGNAGTYLELADNHWFTNRGPIFAQIEKFFSKRAPC